MSRKRPTPADEPYFVIRTLMSDLGPGHGIDRHRHDWHQLIYAAAGVLRVWTERGSWIVPPHWAIWVPGGVTHSIRFAERSRLRTLYIRPDWHPGVPDRCGVVTVSPLLRELIMRATRAGMLDRRNEVALALARLIVDELHRSDAPPFDLPQPQSPALRRAAEATGGMAARAASAGMSKRSFERRFRAETGMSPGQWRRHHALLGALERLAAGAPIKAVAADAGYATPSAFTAAFRARFGVTPGRYFGQA